uniref:Uncharacterized protein n=1 Tax=Timema poppense TaxID=170557 RepID=A0A7R9H8J2_TIMPO|nr:unnamed protein product [Timema poppensis]
MAEDFDVEAMLEAPYKKGPWKAGYPPRHPMLPTIEMSARSAIGPRERPQEVVEAKKIKFHTFPRHPCRIAS